MEAKQMTAQHDFPLAENYINGKIFARVRDISSAYPIAPYLVELYGYDEYGYQWVTGLHTFNNLNDARNCADDHASRQ